MTGHDIIVVGASAGGVEALTRLVNNLPPDLPAAIFVVLHISSQGTSVLPKILNRSVQKHQNASLQASHPLDHEKIQHGRIYIGNAVSSEMEIETDIAELDLAAMQRSERPGTPSPFGCPECGGVLWELQEGKLVRFRCRTGHAFSANTLMAEQSQALEEALWIALRTLEERAALAVRMASQARQRDQRFSAKRFEEQGQDAQQRAALIRKLLLKGYDNGHLSTVNDQVVRGRREQGKQVKVLLPHMWWRSARLTTVD